LKYGCPVREIWDTPLNDLIDLITAARERDLEIAKLTAIAFNEPKKLFNAPPPSHSKPSKNIDLKKAREFMSQFPNKLE